MQGLLIMLMSCDCLVSGDVRGDMAINFSCAPESAARLVDLALEEVEALQAAGPSAEEASDFILHSAILCIRLDEACSCDALHEHSSCKCVGI